jgi:hypothetical protein
MIGLLQQFAERLSMMSDVQFGRVPTGKASALRTLGTTISLLAQGDVRTEQILRRLFHGLSQIWQMVHRLNKRYLPNKKEFRIIGIPEAGQDAYMEAAPDDVDADVDFSFRATMLNTNRQMLAQSLMEIAGIVVSPLAIQMGLVDAGKVHAVIRDYIKARDQDPAQYLNRPPAQVSGPKLLAEEALSAILAGEMPEGAPLEPDPAEHLTKLMEFQAGENFGLLSPPQVQIFKAYLRHVVGLVQQAQQQQVLMQAAQQFQQSRGGNGQAPGGVPTTIQPPGAEQTQVGQNELVDESVGAG